LGALPPNPQDLTRCCQRRVAGAGRAELDFHVPRTCSASTRRGDAFMVSLPCIAISSGRVSFCLPTSMSVGVNALHCAIGYTSVACMVYANPIKLVYGTEAIAWEKFQGLVKSRANFAATSVGTIYLSRGDVLPACSSSWSILARLMR